MTLSCWSLYVAYSILICNSLSNITYSSALCVRMVVTLSSVTSVAVPSAQNASTTLILCHSLLKVPSVAHHAGSAFMAHPGHIM